MNNWVALITDTHAGIRGDSEHFQEYQQKFYRDIFFPTCSEYGVEHIYHLGDIFDRRKFVNFKTLHSYTEHFLEPLKASGMQMSLLVGNHDVTYKNTNEVNSPNLLLKQYDCITIYDDEPVTLNLSTKNKVALIPWINNSNYQETLSFLKDTDANVVFGHFEFSGFEMHRGQISEGGMSTSGFDKFDLVCSGHFHHKSTVGNITYLGAPFEYTWSDFDDERGFHLLNTETLELKYVRNPYTMFEKIIYSGDKTPTTLPEIAGKIVKVVIQENSNPYLFEKFMDKLLKMGAYELSVSDFSQPEVGDLTDDEIKKSAKDTIEIVCDFIESSTDDTVLAEDVKTYIKTLYAESLSEEC